MLKGFECIREELGEYLNDTWTWNGANWREIFPATVPLTGYSCGMDYDAASKVVVIQTPRIAGAQRTFATQGGEWFTVPERHFPAVYYRAGHAPPA